MFRGIFTSSLHQWVLKYINIRFIIFLDGSCNCDGYFKNVFDGIFRSLILNGFYSYTMSHVICFKSSMMESYNQIQISNFKSQFLRRRLEEENVYFTVEGSFGEIFFELKAEIGSHILHITAQIFVVIR
ncbi:hypothetical protein QL285_036247 [Trifolium repens]|nr:hypothetical protein QL285_036247 [Trifolium repens]